MVDALIIPVFNLPMVEALIWNLKTRRDKGEKLFETDYTRILASILPHYFAYSDFCIAPEIWSDDKRKSDFVISNTIVDRNHPDYLYGHSLPWLMVESKNRGAIAWKNLVKEQLYNQVDTNKNEARKLWVIGTIGFTICFFSFWC
jgi:hypothetical protein